METNLQELKDWQDGARRMLDREIEQMREELEQKTDLLRLVDEYKKAVSARLKQLILTE